MGPQKRHLNINMKRNVFRCSRCGVSGGVLDFYALYSGTPRQEVQKTLEAKLHTPQGDGMPRRTHVIQEVSESKLADVGKRHKAYRALLTRLSLASDHRQNLRERGLSDEEIDRLEYKTTPVIGMTALAQQLVSEGLELSGVPGFYKTDKGQWSFVSENRGILIHSSSQLPNL